MTKQRLQHFLALIAIIMAGFAQNANAQGANTYQFAAVAGTFTNLIGGTAFTAVQADQVCPTATVPIGFTFNFAGIDYTTVRAGSNGYLTFSTGSANASANSMTNLNTIKPALMWLWDDLDGANGTATYATTGTAPNRVFTFQFKNWEWFWNAIGPNISCQVKLYESTNVIEYIYNQEAMPGTPSSASIGICDGATTSTYLSLNNSTASPTASSTTFTTSIAAKPASGQIYRFTPTPAIDIKADSIVRDGNFCSNASVPVSVAITNKGLATINDILINWSIDGAAQTPVSYTMPAPMSNFTTAPNNRAIVPLGDVFFPDTSPKIIKAWVVQANGLPDAMNANDTATASKAADLTGIVVNIDPQDAVICGGTQITLDAGIHPKNPVYIWANGHATQTIQVSTAGTYSVKVQNADGCFDYDTVMVASYPNPAVNSIAITDNADGSYTFTPVAPQNITSYVWDFGDGQTQPGSGLPGQVIHQYDVEGNYTVTLELTNNPNCENVIIAKDVTADIPTGINELDDIQRVFSVFPNPAKSQATIVAIDGTKINAVIISNMVGRQVFRRDDIKAVKFQFSTGALAEGIYNLIIDSGKGKVVKKLEVIR